MHLRRGFAELLLRLLRPENEPEEGTVRLLVLGMLVIMKEPLLPFDMHHGDLDREGTRVTGMSAELCDCLLFSHIHDNLH